MNNQEPAINIPPDSLLPTIVQDALTGRVLMLGYSNSDSMQRTTESKKVTFFSRSKQRLWTKGETSGNFLTVVDILIDCDSDTILIKAHPAGPACHTGEDTCFGEKNTPWTTKEEFLGKLEDIIKHRRDQKSSESYVSHLFSLGTPRIAQKVGEEGIETVIEAIKGDADKLREEVADLQFHLMVLLVDQNVSFDSVVRVLQERNANEMRRHIGNNVKSDPA
jgi:phosphoribosyl-AMP cyclohydrolase / phosphoribosyl-ATP pyrophosphohydrolase